MKSKKQKINHQMQAKAKSGITSKQLTLLLAVVTFIYFFFMKTKDKIVNYPDYIYNILFFLIILIFISINIKYFLDRNKLNIYGMIIKIAGVIIMSWFFAGVLLIPFNYYNIYNSLKNEKEYYYCPIISVSTYSKNRSLFFKFKDKVNTINGYNPVMENIKDNNNCEDYLVVVGVRKGYLGSYILENWDIVKK